MTDHTATDTPPLPPAVGAQVERGVGPLVEYEKELARLLAQRKKIDQRRDAVQAQITTLRKTIADIERAHKAAEEAKLSRPWQVKFMRGTPATSGRDIAMLVQYLTTPTTLAAIGREHGISGGRVAQIVAKAVRRLKHPNYWMDGATAPHGWGAEDIRASAEAWLSALGRAEERHNAELSQGPVQRVVRPLRRGEDGICTRSTCDCEREGLGDQCIWLRPTDAELERRTAEPHIDGWPLYSGLPPPAKSERN